MAKSCPPEFRRCIFRRRFRSTILRLGYWLLESGRGRDNTNEYIRGPMEIAIVNDRLRRLVDGRHAGVLLLMEYYSVRRLL